MYESYIPTVVQAVPWQDQTVFAYFSDGSIRHFDVKPLIAQGGVFARLADPDFFRDRLTVLNDTVAWDVSGHFDPTVCIDIDPFAVYAAEAVSDPLEAEGFSA